MQARHLIHYVPHAVQAPGLFLPAGIGALMYVERGADVYGWFAQARHTRYSAAFFMIENYYAQQTAVVYRSLEDDVYSAWERELPGPVREVRNPIPDALGHELERLQSAFMDEWLFFVLDPHSGPEVESYRRVDLPLHAFNIRYRRLGKMVADGQRDAPWPFDEPLQWLHQSSGADPNIHDLLNKCWRIDHHGINLKPEILSASRA